jgi:hypothetical protein
VLSARHPLVIRTSSGDTLLRTRFWMPKQGDQMSL